MKTIEKKIKAYIAEQGYIGLEKDFTPSEFKAIEDEVIMKFLESNKKEFKIDEVVALKM